MIRGRIGVGVSDQRAAGGGVHQGQIFAQWSCNALSCRRCSGLGWLERGLGVRFPVESPIMKSGGKVDSMIVSFGPAGHGAFGHRLQASTSTSRLLDGRCPYQLGRLSPAVRWPNPELRTRKAILDMPIIAAIPSAEVHCGTWQLVFAGFVQCHIG